MRCPNCGAQLKEPAAFCHYCGCSLKEEAPVSAQPEEVKPDLTPKKKSRKKLLIGIIAGVTALAVGIGALSAYLISHPKVYLRTKITEYDEEGQWSWTVEYDYNQQGSPTEIKLTTSDFDYVSEIVNNMEILKKESNGGRQVRTLTFEYNDEGHCVYSDDVYRVYDKDGNLCQDKSTDTITGGCQYQYHDDGTIDKIQLRGFQSDGSLGDEYSSEDRYHYDDDGRLYEISRYRETGDSGLEFVAADFRYDDEGRMTASCYRPLDGARLYEYEYDSQGNLEEVTLSIASYNQAPFDNDHYIDLSDYGYCKFNAQYEAEFEYDNRGRLISREVKNLDHGSSEKAELEYQGKFLSRIEGEDYVVRIVANEKEAQRLAEKMNPSDAVMVRDKHGNIIKAIGEDGSYAEYEYEAFRLSKAQARQHGATMVSLHRIDLMGMKTAMYGFASGSGFVSSVSYPTHELYDIDVLLALLNHTIKY